MVNSNCNFKFIWIKLDLAEILLGTTKYAWAHSISVLGVSKTALASTCYPGGCETLCKTCSDLEIS